MGERGKALCTLYGQNIFGLITNGKCQRNRQRDPRRLTNVRTAGLQLRQPFTVVDGISIPGGEARPDLGGDPFAPGTNCPETRTPQSWFNPAAFRKVPDPNNPSSALPGNEGRNILRAPSYRNFDLGLINVIPLTERIRLQFRGNFFNLSNTPHFAIPLTH